MKNSVLSYSVIICLLLAAGLQAPYSQWQTDVRLTNDAGLSIVNSDKSVATSGNYVHVVWSDDRNGTTEIYYKRSTNGGVNWSSDIRLTNLGGYSEEPSVSVSGSVVHVVWRDYHDGNYEIYYKRSSNNGTNWSTETRLTNNSSNSAHPCISADGYVHVVWTDDEFFHYSIFYKRSTDGGLSWGSNVQLSHGSNLEQAPSIAISGSNIHVVWEDQRISVVNSEIYYRYSLNRGNSWGAEIRLTSNSSYSEDPSVSSSGTDVHVSWYDFRDGNEEIYYKRSTNNGANWESDVRLTNNTSRSYLTSISVSGPIVHDVWIDDRNGNEEIYYRRSINRGASWSTETRLTNDANESRFPSVTFSGLVVHLVWADKRNTNWEIYYKRNPTGNPNAITKISSEVPVSFILHQNYPNPFNPVTYIGFSIPERAIVSLVVFNIAGCEVEVLANQIFSAGTYRVDFDASKLASGVYFYRMNSGHFNDTKKMILMK